MIATIALVTEKFRMFNRLMFGGRLPEIPVRISDATTFLGMCVAKVETLPDGSRHHQDFELRMSRRHDLPEHELEDVIIHEMIHYFIMYNELHDSSPHGEIFKAMMRSINRTYGRHITISRRISSEEKAAISAQKRKWHVIASVTFRNGSHGLKVLPRVIPKILDYHRVVSASPDVEAVELYLHDDPFFNRYPVSAAYKIHHIDQATLSSCLRGAKRLIPNNGKLLQR